MRADIHDGQEHERSIHGPDTEAQDQSPPSLTSGLQHTAGPYSWVKSGHSAPQYRTSLFDHLVGAHEQRRWHSEAESSGGFEVDYQFILSGVLHWKVGQFRTL